MSDCNVDFQHISFLKRCLKRKMFENQDPLLLVFRYFAVVITITNPIILCGATDTREIGFKIETIQTYCSF